MTSQTPVDQRSSQKPQAYGVFPRSKFFCVKQVKVRNYIQPLLGLTFPIPYNVTKKRWIENRTCLRLKEGPNIHPPIFYCYDSVYSLPRWISWPNTINIKSASNPKTLTTKVIGISYMAYHIDSFTSLKSCMNECIRFSYLALLSYTPWHRWYPIGYQRCHGVYDKRARYENLIHSFIQDFKLVKLSIWYAMYEMPMTFVVRVLGFEADFMFMVFGQEIHLGKL